MKHPLVKYIAAAILVLLSFFILVRGDHLQLFQKVSLLDLLWVVIAALLLFTVSGIKTGIITAHQYNTKLKAPDYVLLPIMIHWWSYVFPVKGGLVFSTLFLKMKYRVKAVAGVSIFVYTYLISIILAGLYGLYYTISNGMIFTPGTLFFLLLVLSPLFIKILHKLLRNIPTGKKPFKEIKAILDEIIENSTLLFSNPGITLYIVLLSIISILGYVIWYRLAANAFGIEGNIDAVVMVAFANILLGIVRLIPGNLGLSEMVSGGTFELMGGTMEQGILIALLIRFSALILTFIIGTAGIIINMKYFSVKSILTMWRKLKESTENRKDPENP
jgi:hypothetical protein